MSCASTGEPRAVPVAVRPVDPPGAAGAGALVDGLSGDEIAKAHYVAVTTVRSQVRGILQKLGVNSQLAAVATAVRAGWTVPDFLNSEEDARSAAADAGI
jgi:hypothetical protein